MMKTTIDAPDAAARKAIRVRALTDPLGAKGHRRTTDRVERECRARQLAFGGVLAAFGAFLGFASTSHVTGENPNPGYVDASAATIQGATRASTNEPIDPTRFRSAGSGDAPEQAPVVHARTRSSG